LKKKLLKNYVQSISLHNQINSVGSADPNSSTKPEGIQEEDLIRGELENLDSKTKSNYDALIYYFGEENLRKIFSNQVIFKEEGLDTLLKSLKEIIERTIKENKNNKNNNSNSLNPEKTESETSKIINLIMKLVFILMKDKHPHVSIKTIDIFQTLLSTISEVTLSKQVATLAYDLTITDKILFKIKEKLGDPNPKIRTKAVDLYCLLLRQNLCDYNNLLSELLEDELRHHIDTKKVVKSSKTIIGKLSIFDNVFDEIQNSLGDKRTDEKTFPFTLILKYVIENLTNTKSEIRKLARRILVKMYTAFGYKKIEPFIKKVDERELEKLVELMPEVAETLLKSKQIGGVKLLSLNSGIAANNNSSVVYPISSNKSLLMRKSLEKKNSNNASNNINNNHNTASNSNNKVNNNNKRNEKRKLLGKYQIQSSVVQNNDNSNNNNNNENSLIKMNSVISGGAAELSNCSPQADSINVKATMKLESYSNDYLKILNNINSINNSTKSPVSSPNKAAAAAAKSVLPNNKNKVLICSYCGKSDESFLNSKDLEAHKSSDCRLFSNCAKCNQNVEVRLLNQHLLAECAKKSESKQCKRCKEPVDFKSYEEHIKSNSCNPAKNLNSSNRCPLCHKDIPPYDKGFVQHLVNDSCQMQSRKND